MGKGDDEEREKIEKDRYRDDLRELQIELVKLQRHFIAKGDKILVILEGRDAAGKDGTIKRITAHLSPRETRVVALGKPSDREVSSWYFQRFVPHLPAGGEFVLFNRSWYNRAGVERVMGFCTEEEYEAFFDTVLEFEHMLVRSGIQLIKYYLDISKAEQKQRMQDRRHDPLKQWKISPIDAVAVKHWEDYTQARDIMLARTHNPVTPWTVVKADEKRALRLNLIRDLLFRVSYEGKNGALLASDPAVVMRYDKSLVERGLVAR